jgi:hypothetical protein
MSIRKRAVLRAVSISIFGLIAATLVPSDPAHAQVDPNIQSRIDIVAAPFQVQPLQLDAGKQAAETTCYESKRRCLSETEIDALFQKQSKTKTLLEDLSTNRNLLAELKSAATPLARKRQIVKALALPINVKPKPGETAPSQPTAVKFTFPQSPTYETNATKSNTNPMSDSSMTLAGGFTVTAQGFRNLDVVGFSAGSSSVRYARLTTKDFDTLTASALYQAFLGAYDGQGKPLDLSKGSMLPTGQITFNTLTFGLQNSTTFVPTFRAESVDLFTPTIVYGWQNIALDRSPCSSRLMPSVSSFCYYMDVAVTVGQTLSDVTSLQNSSVGLSTTFGDRIADSDFVLTLTSTLTGKVFENVLGGRNDFTVQVGPKLTYTPLKNVSASLAVTYNQNFSTLATAAWHGWIILPTFTLAF